MRREHGELRETCARGPACGGIGERARPGCRSARPAPNTGARVRFLQRLAAEAGLELFTPRPGGAEGPHPLCEHLHEREVTLTPTLRDALRRHPLHPAMN